MERSQGSMHEHNDITADLNVNAFERRRWHGVEPSCICSFPLIRCIARWDTCIAAGSGGGNKANETRTGLLINIGSENCNERIINGVIRKCTLRKCISARYKIWSTYILVHHLSPLQCIASPSPSTLTPPLYLLGNVLLTFGDRRSSGTGRFEPRAQLVQSRVPLRIAVHAVSVEDGRWGLGAAQRRHFKPRETEWKIEESNRERDRRGRQIHQM